MQLDSSEIHRFMFVFGLLLLVVGLMEDPRREKKA
jgi:hypothetical protein